MTRVVVSAAVLALLAVAGCEDQDARTWKVSSINSQQAKQAKPCKEVISRAVKDVPPFCTNTSGGLYSIDYAKCPSGRLWYYIGANQIDEFEHWGFAGEQWRTKRKANDPDYEAARKKCQTIP